MEGAYRTMRPQRGNHGFRFEAKWLQEEGCEEIVRNAWSNASFRGENDLSQILRRIAGDLKNWDTNVLGDLEKRIKTIKTELEHVRRTSIDENTVSREHLWREKLDRLEHQQDIFQRQRAHVKWLQAGDKNTTFFSCLCVRKEE
ncbi:unnamed protein product [Triticum turgidum subsp. durum]|uniref:Uncharacterized protein n=1 Tax=Triticum turgidum subsp. durum TaxID=4567 RepID=A0A9R1NUI5_TRITD|nr:unnamed protein product [Triticum turgidum subsp. durum]